MTLRRKFLTRNLALVAGLIVIGTASVWGLHGLRQEVRTANYLYGELQAVEDAQLKVAEAAGQAASNPPDVKAIDTSLASAITRLEEFTDRSKNDHQAAPDNYSDKRLAAAHVMGMLRGAREQLSRAGAAPRPAVTGEIASQLRSAIKHLQDLNYDCDQLMHAAQQSATQRVRWTTGVVAGLSAIGIAAAIFLSIAQHRSVMHPLHELRDGVRKLAGGDFSQRCPVTGDKEFVELSEEFNRMAAELEDFYKRLEQKVAIKSKELVRSERLASVGFLAAGVAHEINNPLNIISGYAELSMKQLVDQPGKAELAEALRVIRDEAFRCKEITAKLLSLARSGDGHRENFSLSNVAADVTGMLHGLKNYRDRRVDVRLGKDDPLLVHGSPNEIKQVLLNLTVNALEACKPGIGEVSIDGRRQGSWVELIVADNGRGMSAEVLDHVFEPFFTDKRGTPAPGTGLGLSITHAIIEGHGGQIRAESDGLGHGSKFVVRLPAAPVGA